jgi:uncharacterized membrane protein YraQ (UPF0718 family)
MQAEISWNYTTWLNIVFLVIATVLVIRFIATNGLPMLRMMGGSPGVNNECHDHTHGHH